MSLIRWVEVEANFVSAPSSSTQNLTLAPGLASFVDAHGQLELDGAELEQQLLVLAREHGLGEFGAQLRDDLRECQRHPGLLVFRWCSVQRW